MSATDPCTVVLDTNVALDLLWFDDPRTRPLAAALEGGHARLLSAPSLRDELARQLRSARLARWARAPEQAAAALQRYDSWCHRGAYATEPPPARRPALRCSDTDDQVFIDLALCNGARWLLSRDHALLKLARHAWPWGLRIATPAAWLASVPARGDGAA